MAGTRLFSRLWILLVLAAPMVVSAQCVTPPADMAGWIPFDSSLAPRSGIVTATSSTGLAHVPAVVGNGVRLGSQDFIRLTNVPASPDGGATVEFWLSADEISAGTSQVPRLFLTSGPVSLGFANTDANDGTPTLELIGPSPRPSATLSLQVGSNVHVAVTSTTSGGARVYINGNLLASSTSPAVLLSDAMSIGNPGVPGLRSFNGVYDELSIYTRALSANEIASIANAGTSGKCLPGSGPIDTDALLEDGFEDRTFEGAVIDFAHDATIIASPVSTTHWSVTVNDPSGLPIPSGIVDFSVSDGAQASVTPDGSRAASITLLPGADSVIVTATLRGSGIRTDGVLIAGHLEPRSIWVPSENVVSISTTSVVLTRNATTDGLRVGDVVLTGSSTPMLGRVASVSTGANEITIGYADAYLDEFFATAPDVPKLPATRARVTLEGGILRAVASNGKILAHRNLATDAAKSLSCSTSGSNGPAISVDFRKVHAQLDPSFSFEPFLLRNGQGAISGGQVIGVLDYEGRVTTDPLALSGQWQSGAKVTCVIGTLTFPVASAFYVVNLGVGIELALVGEVTGTGELSFAFKPSHTLSATGRARAGVRYQSGWTLIGDNSTIPSYTIEGGGLSAGVSLEAEAYGSLSAIIGVRTPFPFLNVTGRLLSYDNGGRVIAAVVTPINPSSQNYIGPTGEIEKFSRLKLGDGVTGLLSDQLFGRLISIIRRTTPADSPTDGFDVSFYESTTRLWNFFPTQLTAVPAVANTPDSNIVLTVSNLPSELLGLVEFLAWSPESTTTPIWTSAPVLTLASTSVDRTFRAGDVAAFGPASRTIKFSARYRDLVFPRSFLPLAPATLRDVTFSGVTSPIAPTIVFAPPTTTPISVDQGVPEFIVMTPTLGQGTGASATTVVGTCVVPAGYSASPNSLTFIGADVAKTMTVNCSTPGASGSLTCPYSRGGQSQGNVVWPLSCDPPQSNSPPQLRYDPLANSTLTFNNGTGAIVVSTVVGSGSGSGAAATTRVQNCSAASGFFSVPATTWSFQPGGASQTIAMSCTPQTTQVSATLSCTELPAGGTSVVRQWTLVCPAQPATFAIVSLDPAAVTTSTAPYFAALTLRGSGFSNLNRVNWSWSGSTSGNDQWTPPWSSNVTIVSDTELVLRPRVTLLGEPVGTSNWNVTLTNTLGATASRNFTVTYQPPAPTITLVNPTQINTSTRPLTVTIDLNGSNLDRVDKIVVLWNGAVGADNTTWLRSNATQWAAKVMSQSAGLLRIRPTVLASGDPPGLTNWTVRVYDQSTGLFAEGHFTVTLTL